MTDFEMLAKLMKKANKNIADWIVAEDEEEIEVYFGDEWGYGMSFFFNAKTGMIKRGE